MQINMDKNEFIVSKTDLDGKIIYGNETFIKMSGYEEKELLHAPHNILRHTQMPAVVFKLLWERLKNKKAINAFVKNQTKNGDHYWVFANVTPSFDSKNNVVGYYSVRRKPRDEALQIIGPIYDKLLEIEKGQGVQASQQHLETHLAQQGTSYDAFVFNLQK